MYVKIYVHKTKNDDERRENRKKSLQINEFHSLYVFFNVFFFTVSYLGEQKRNILGCVLRGRTLCDVMLKDPVDSIIRLAALFVSEKCKICIERMKYFFWVPREAKSEYFTITRKIYIIFEEERKVVEAKNLLRSFRSAREKKLF